MRGNFRSFPWFGVLLIVVGTMLLLDRLAVLNFGYSRIFWGTVSLFGLFQVTQGFSRNRNGSIFWGTVLFLYGVYFFIRTFDVFEFRSDLFLPSSLIIFGVSFLMVYSNNIKEWFLLVPGLLLGGLGTILLLGQLEIYDLWEIWMPIRRYWPVALIVTGVALLLSGRLKRPT